MLKYLNSKLIFGAVLCLAIGIFLLDSRVDASAIRSRDSSEEDSDENNGWGRDWDWNRDRDRDKKKKKFKCPSSYGTFSDIEDCTAYFVCNNWKSKWKSCQKKKRFDRYRKVCLPFIIAVCDDGSDDKTTKGVPGTTTPKEDSFTCPSFKGTFPDPDDCSKYYKCTFFIPSLKTCGKNLLFDGVKKECKPEGEVNCGSRKRPTSETTAGTTPIPTRPEPTTTPPTTPQPTTTPPTTPQPTTPPTTPQPTTTPPTTPQPTTPPPTTPQPTTTPPTTPQPTTTPPTTPQPTTTPPTTPQPTSTPTPKPTGPPETNCDEDDLDCIIKETGEIPEWFECPEAIGAYRHPSSNKLFIFCKNWKPFVKKCGQDLVYSDEMRTCITQ